VKGVKGKPSKLEMITKVWVNLLGNGGTNLNKTSYEKNQFWDWRKTYAS